MRSGDVTVVIPTIPPRAQMLRRAVSSALNQTHPPVALSIAVDTHKEGSAATRNRALAAARTPWVAFLDDDDQFLPGHIGLLLDHAEETGADVIYSWPEVIGGNDPRPDRFGKPFDPDELRRGSYIPVTSLCRTAVICDAGGFQTPPGSIYDDWGAYLAMLDRGARFAHLPQRTWIWNHHDGNTSGQPHRW